MFGRIKGTVIVACVKALRARRDDALPMLGEAAQRFLGPERVLPSSWYDEAVAFELYQAFARLIGGGRSPMRTWHEMGRQAATIHAVESYRHVVQARDTASILCASGVALFQSQHDTGKLKATMVGTHTAHIEIRGFGAMCSEWSHMIAGYLRGLVEVTGATDIEVRIDSVDLAHKDACFTVSWREPATA
jgi:hypothetical protein